MNSIVHGQYQVSSWADADSLIAVLAVLTAPVAVFDETGLLLGVSEGWRDLGRRTGCALFARQPKETFLPKEQLGISDPSDTICEVAAGVKALLSGKLEELRVRYTADAQQQFFLNFKKTSGLKPMLIGVSVEATNCQSDAVETRELSERFRLMTANIAEIFWLVDPREKRVLYISPAFEKISGRKCEELYGPTNSYENLIHPEDRQHALVSLEQMAQGREFEQEFRLLRPDGSIRWLRNRCSVLRDASGQIYRTVGVAQDITSRKEAELALRESEERNRDLVENSHDLLCTHDLTGRLLSLNPLPAKLLGYTVEELLSMPMRELMAPEFRDQFENEYLLRIKRDGHASGLLVVMTRLGERRIWAYNNTLRTKGVPVPIVRGMAHDITEQKRAEAALRRSEEKFAKAFHACPSPMAITTLREGRMLDVNASFEHQTGYTREEVIGKSAEKLRIWADLADRAAVMAALREGKAVRNHEFTVRTKGNQLRTAFYSGEPIMLGDEECVLALTYDITEQKKAQEALRRSEAEYRALVEGAPYGILRAARDGKLLMANGALVKILGYHSEKAIVGRNVAREVFLAADDFYHLVDSLRGRSEHFKNMFLHWRRRDGTPIVVRASGRMAGNECGEGAHLEAIVEDVTDLRRALAMEELSTLAVGFMQSFHQLLANILGTSELLILEGKIGKDERIRLEQVLNSGIQARAVTRKVMELWQSPLWSVQPVTLNRFAEQMEDFFRPLVAGTIEIRKKLNEKAGAVLADQGDLTKIVMNLVNYLRAKAPCGGQLTLETEQIVLAAPSPSLPGLSSGSYGVLALQLSHTVSEASRASGRGEAKEDAALLLPMQLMVEHNRGFLRRTVNKNRQPGFEIILPSCHAVSEEFRSEPKEKILPNGEKTIMVVDFDDTIRRLAVAFLEAHGYKVLQANTAKAALGIIEQHRFPIHLILADEVIYEGGADEFERWRTRHPETRMLCITGFPAPTHHVQGVDRRLPVVERPFLRCELLGKVQEVLGKPVTH